MPPRFEGDMLIKGHYIQLGVRRRISRPKRAEAMGG
jgi:hypothetical protein